jgi:hypothetical protein
MNGETDPVTIVMATRNGAPFLAAQLDSIAGQSHRDWTLFVSDDGSTDATRSILADFARHHPVRLVEGPRQGAAANFLSALCHPELPAGIVALADQDDVWLQGKLARGVRRMAASPGDGPLLYAAESLLTDAGLRPLRRSSAGRAQPGFPAALCQNLFGGHTVMLNPSAVALLRRAGAPAGIAYHDWWIYQLIAGAEGKLLLDPRPTARYRQHQGNSLGGLSGRSGSLRRLAMVLSGRWRADMRAQARALNAVRPLLLPAAQARLDGYLAAASFGPARAVGLQRAGVVRSSRAGTAAMLAACMLGLI